MNETLFLPQRRLLMWKENKSNKSLNRKTWLTVSGVIIWVIVTKGCNKQEEDYMVLLATFFKYTDKYMFMFIGKRETSVEPKYVFIQECEIKFYT